MFPLWYSGNFIDLMMLTTQPSTEVPFSSGDAISADDVLPLGTMTKLQNQLRRNLSCRRSRSARRSSLKRRDVRAHDAEHVVAIERGLRR